MIFSGLGDTASGSPMFNMQGRFTGIVGTFFVANVGRIHRNEGLDRHMKKEYVLRTVRIDDFVADSLEAKAKLLPPSYKEQAESLLRQARELRTSSRPGTIQFWEKVLPEPEP